MSVQLINHDGLERSLKIVIPAKKVDGEVLKKLNEYRRSANWKGFRKGMVPQHLIKAQFGEQIRENVLNDLLQPSLFDAIKEQDLELAAQPTIDLLVDEEGKDLEYEAKFEILPEIKLADLSKCKIVNPICELPEQVILDGMEKVKSQHTNWQVVDEAAAEHQQVCIDFKGYINGETFPGGEGENYKFVLGQGQMLKEFEKAIIGKRSGDTIEFPLSFPKDYHKKELAGVKARFTVKLQEVCAGSAVELNQDFYNKIDVKEGTEEAFKGAVSRPLKNELNQRLLDLKKARVYKSLLKNHKVDLPKISVKKEVQSMLEAQKKEQKLAALPETTSAVRKEAEKRVALSLISGALMDSLKLKLDEERVKQYIKSKAVPYLEEQQFIDWFNTDKERVNMAHRQVLEEQLVEACFGKMTAKDASVKYDQLEKIIEEEWKL